MKEIRTIRMVEQTTVKFIANDGKEFDNEKDCAAYERRLDKERCAKEFRKLDAVLIKFPFTGWGCPIDVYKVTLNGMVDIDTIMDYFVTKHPYIDCDLYHGRPTEYPCTRFIVADEGYVGYYSATPEDIKNQLIEALAKL